MPRWCAPCQPLSTTPVFVSTCNMLCRCLISLSDCWQFCCHAGLLCVVVVCCQPFLVPWHNHQNILFHWSVIRVAVILVEVSARICLLLSCSSVWQFRPIVFLMFRLIIRCVGVRLNLVISSHGIVRLLLRKLSFCCVSQLLLGNPFGLFHQFFFGCSIFSQFCRRWIGFCRRCVLFLMQQHGVLDQQHK